MENIVRLWPYETYSKETPFRDRLMAGRHALNVEIEVRVLVPKCRSKSGSAPPNRSKSGSAAPSHDDFGRDRLRFSAGKPTPAKPASAAKSWAGSSVGRAPL